jgi:hypothetical protein
MPAPVMLLAATWLALAGPGPTVAVEDTMRTELPPVLVTAPRVTLAEILQRVARGEARRDSLLHDQTMLATVRIVSHADDPHHAPELLSETVYRVYRRRHPPRARTLTLRQFEAHPPRHGGRNMQVQFGIGMDEEVVNFAFRPAAHRDFGYTIEGRDLVGGHLVYRIRFTPRSLLDPAAPHGLVWIDTNEFVIVRQEVGFDHPPAPPFIEGVDRMVIERMRADGHWVLHRVLLRARAGLPLPKVGRSFDMSLVFEDYAINRGLSDSVFTAPAAAR